MRPDAADPGPGAGATYLPFWQLGAAGAGDAPRAWVPAFRYRRLKALHDLAVRLTTKPPVYRAWAGERPAVHGCFYDVEDAVLLARFAAAGRQRTPGRVKAAAEDEPGFAGARLTWIPFAQESRSLRDPSTGFALQEALLG
jgi:hypothetical protein